MKKLLTILTITFLFSCCSKKDDDKPVNPVDQLPPATQTGANTFGCLLNGQVFKPGFTNNSYQCFYQLVNGDYYFKVGANNNYNNNVVSLLIGTEKKTISQGQTLDLFERVDGNAFGSYLFNVDFNNTSIINTGQLKITKLTFNPNIVSGTFWYDVKDSQNVVHQIREGRFDMQFTQ